MSIRAKKARSGRSLKNSKPALRDYGFSKETLRQAWERFQHQAWEPDDEPTTAVLAGVILFDEPFARLLNEAERSQMSALAKVALERYQQITHPPNKLGKIIAATVKESI